MRLLRSIAGPLAAVVGAVLVFIGAFSVWAQSHVDPSALDRAIEVNRRFALDVTDFLEASYTWVEGVYQASSMLVLTAFGIVLAVSLILRERRWVAAALAALGAAVAIVAFVTVVDPPVLAAQIASDAEDLVVGTFVFGDGPLADVIDVTGGPSTALCVSGGVLMLLGGLFVIVFPRPEHPGDPDYIPWKRADEGGPA